MSEHNYDIEQRTLTTVPTLFGSRRLDRDMIAEGLAEILPRAFGHAMEQGLQMVGPPFVRYVEQSPAFVTVEAGVPLAAVPEGAEPADGLAYGELPAGTAVATVHTGPYESLGEAHTALDRWMAAHDATPAGGPWEIYLTDPGEVPDPADWRTEVVWPIH